MKTIDIINFIIESEDFTDSCRVTETQVIATLSGIDPVSSSFITPLIEKGLDFIIEGGAIHFSREID